MNILVICESIDLTNGGSIGQTKRIIQGLKNIYNITLFTTLLSDKANLDLSGINVYEFPTGPRLGINDFKYITNISKTKIKRILEAEKIDLIYNVHPTPISKKIRLVSRKANIPFVNHVHVPRNQNLHMLPKIIRFKFIGKIIDNYITACYKDSDVVVLTGTFDKELEAEIRGTRAKIKIISNGIDTEKYKKCTNKSELTKKYNLSDAKKILYVGRYSAEKNIVTLLDACKDISDYELLVVGHEEIKVRFKSYFTNKNIIHMGPRTQDELVEIYSLAEVLIHPSLIELESLVFLEAISCSLPIIISDSIENKTNQYMHNNGFLFKSKVPTDLAEKINIILKDDGQRIIMGNESRKIALRLDFKSSLLEFTKLFNELAHTPRE